MVLSQSETMVLSKLLSTNLAIQSLNGRKEEGLSLIEGSHTVSTELVNHSICELPLTGGWAQS